MEKKPLFPLGQVVSTPGAIKAFMEEGGCMSDFLQRHVTGDWGEISAVDKAANVLALATGERIMSVYRTARRKKFLIITEADRSSTCLLLPEDY